MKSSASFSYGWMLPALAALLLTGCQTSTQQNSSQASSSTSSTPTPAPKTDASSSSSASSAPTVSKQVIRINAGTTAPYTDSAGNVWQADHGFADGETIERPSDLSIANTKDPQIYRTERYQMTSFSQTLPNGRYTVKLHFCETFEGITGPGMRVFSFNVEGQDFKDFDVFAKAGGAQKPYIVTVDVNITDGKLDIKFTSNVENPEINGIEIIPGS